MFGYLRLSFRKACLLIASLIPPGWDTPLNRMRNLCFRAAGMRVGVALLDRGLRCPFPHNVTIGHRVSIGHDAAILAFQEVEIESNTIVGAQLLIVAGSHDKESFQPLSNQRVQVGSGCWIGARTTIVGGVTIGKGAIIGCCSLVRDNVNPFDIVAGIPAKKIGSRHATARSWNNFGEYDTFDEVQISPE